MSSQDEFTQLINQARKLPDEPGVYFFLNNKKEILYIGKATSLKNRVRSYFASDLIKTRGRLLVDMIAQAKKINFVKTDSVLEALILEANLIKTHYPKYNTKEKDNKSYNYVVFTDDKFPKILTIRGRALGLQNNKEYKYTFGPFPQGGQLKEAMKIIRRIFPYSDNKCVPCEEQLERFSPNSSLSKEGRIQFCRPCFNRQIGLCPGVCTGEITQEEYAEQIKNLKLFFEGRKKELLKNLEKEMKQYAKSQEFEKAAQVRKTIFALTHIQDIALLKQENKIDESAGGEFAEDRSGIFRIEAYDIAHSSGKNVVGVMVVVENSEVNKSQYRKFRIRINPGVNDTGALKEVLRRRLGHLEWALPNLIVVDGAQAQINVAESVLNERGLTIPVISVVKDERHKPREILGNAELAHDHGRAALLANSEAHRFAITYHRKKRDRIV